MPSSPTTIEFTSKITVRCVQQVGGDHMIVAAARVSTTGEEALKFASASADDNYGLIKYLMSMRHGSVFEHSFLSFFVHAPIFVFREWMRHRIGHSYNESSARYAEMKPIFWIPSPERKMIPAKDHKSARPKFEKGTEDSYNLTIEEIKHSCVVSWGAYQTMLGNGIAKEVARCVLPVGIYSSCWVSVNPRSLLAFLSLRTHEPDAKFVSYPQAEIEEAARACEEVLKEGWPLTWRAFQECGRVAP